MSQWPLPSPSTMPHEVRRRQGFGEEEGHEDKHDAPRRQKPPHAVHGEVPEALPSRSPAHSTLRFTMMTVCRSSGAPGLTASTRSACRSGYSGAPCSRLSTSPLCRLLMILRRRWCNSCQVCCVPSRLSKCPRSCLRLSPCERQFASRSWRNSWWTCRRSYPILAAATFGAER